MSCKLCFLPLLVVVAALFFACAPPPPEEDGLDPRLSVLQEKVFRPSCSLGYCHDSDEPIRGLSLDAADLHAAIVDVDSTLAGWKYVVPGAPESSLLLQVLKGRVDSMDQHASQMPPGDALAAEKLAAVEAWIAAGAADD